MSEGRGTERTYRFGGATFDARTGELTIGEDRSRLPPQPASLLSVLLERGGELVTRDELHDALWPDTVVEFDKSLNFCMRQVRAALGEEAASPRFIETLPRRGYRLIPEVEVLASRDQTEPTGDRRTSDTGGLPVGPAKEDAPRRGRGRVSSGARAALAFGVVTAAAIGVGVLFHGGARAPHPLAREAGEMGGYLLTRGGDEDTRRSLDFFREALAIDPGYARAYAGLGSAYLRLSRVEEGKRALMRSLELDPRQWQPRLTLAMRALYTEYDRETARHHFDRALALAPDITVVRHTYAWARAADGDLDEAITHLEAALELDPVSPRVNGDVGRIFYLAGRNDEAVGHCRRTARLVPDALRPRDCVVSALFEKGAPGEAATEALRVMREFGAPAEVLRETTEATEGTEDVDERIQRLYWRWSARAIERLADRGESSHVHAAAAWARLGENDRAFTALEAAYAVRCPVLLQIPWDPGLRVLRRDPRFGAWTTRIGADRATEARRAVESPDPRIRPAPGLTTPG